MIERRRVISLAAASLFVACGVARAQSHESGTAPLGLRWGSSIEEVRADGIELKDFQGRDYGATYFATKLEKALSDQSGTLLSFGFNNKLWRIVVLSRDYSNDPAGSGVLERYSQLSASLREKYGKPSTVHQLGESIYSQPRYFLAGIRGGESRWYSNFKTSDMQIQLGLIATDNSTGSWRLIYEYAPLSVIFEDAKKTTEKDKL
ncbi:hypothetical protein [Bradyrhizobium elkanii]|uniref:hypothetical protein n=1 Tax=Bradyrhizobium elkanii TaxID=29448 RepID=UPI0021681161|nr:hypothetical protein [Bradyrhizobium elkanii]MCS3519279.1 hypothetical protein [Bradyrhizobium elkanii]MCS4066936.1 hypothetical protein [Bradyrhizobium elkanii]MCS4082471.1 hypothetical protein [Bradyrhizobium elkanii]MCW2127910.1 hypothetical protein [Bradyrhizobium elkanii]MCW2174653.1 hypothetical protein [Bradyrhizobium elkanii]